MTRRPRLHVSPCNNNKAPAAAANDDWKVDRRNLLVGLGGVYGYGALNPLLASADPINGPDISSCGPADLPDNVDKLTNCCPPVPAGIVDFDKLRQPPRSAPLRVRRAAHLVAKDEAYMDKFTKAVELMKALPDDDPRSFLNQAKIHCAYCCGAYDQAGFPDLELQVHFSWLFHPFHRCYLYFFERILGKLIDDPTFAMPFWNWDHPDGMQMPSIYIADQNSPLYDRFRNSKHMPPNIVDFDYGIGSDSSILDAQQLMSQNLTIMYRQLVSLGPTARMFLGSPYRAGDDPGPGLGSLESVPHGSIHAWTGDPSQPNGEDMGSFYTSGRDIIFHAHHGNIDRMWEIWKTLGGRRQNFSDPDWLDSSLLFYDENAQMVRIKVRDCLDTRDLGYVYQDVEIPWLNSRPTPRASNNRVLRKAKKFAADAGTDTPAAADKVFPRRLDKVVRATVRRPTRGKHKRNNEEEEEEEILVIEGVEVEKDVYVKFDVLVNEEDEAMATPKHTEFCGSFVSVPHGGDHHHHKQQKMIKTEMRLTITELLEDLNAENDDQILVTLVPKTGCEGVKIGGLKIVFDS
ncbi:unnamed protein product [Cuscuta campestris]|uniref:catechol oxidase n=1 Tax=Cuscuta campestris TaxID=132261 RepID=A0A484MKM2_9ASTE|nr:unnamed protein product [Cuscuta campestris]